MRLLAEERSLGHDRAADDRARVRAADRARQVPRRDGLLGRAVGADVELRVARVGAGEGAVDMGAIGATYLGLFCIGAFYMAVGLFMSAVARNQIVAALLTFMVLGGLFVLGLFSFITLDDGQRAVFEYLGLWTQMQAFAKGIVDTRYLVYDLSLAAFALFLSVRVLQANRWQ